MPCNDSQHNCYMCTCLYGFVFINLAVLARGQGLVCTLVVSQSVCLSVIMGSHLNCIMILATNIHVHVHIKVILTFTGSLLSASFFFVSGTCTVTCVFVLELLLTTSTL